MKKIILIMVISSLALGVFGLTSNSKPLDIIACAGSGVLMGNSLVCLAIERLNKKNN